MESLRYLLIASGAALALGGPGLAAADWTLYMGGDLGTSSATVDSEAYTTLLNRTFGGDFSDTSPLIAGAFGLSIPLDETTPWELPYDLRLPTWPARLEVEATGLRSFEGRSRGPAAAQAPFFFGETTSWSLLVDVWQEIPLQTLDRPLSSLFGRIPRVLKQTLRHTSFEGGAGIGVAGIDFLFTDNGSHSGAGTSYNFAWQAGGGFDYALTPAVAIRLGYRYFDFGRVEGSVSNPVVGQVYGPLSLRQTSHEFRAGLRISLLSFRSPYLLLPK